MSTTLATAIDVGSRRQPFIVFRRKDIFQEERLERLDVSGQGETQNGRQALVDVVQNLRTGPKVVRKCSNARRTQRATGAA